MSLIVFLCESAIFAKLHEKRVNIWDFDFWNTNFSLIREKLNGSEQERS